MIGKCAENTLAYHLENRFNKGGIDIDVRADMLKDIAGLSFRDQLKRIEGAKSEFERLLSQDEINLEKNAARKAWTEECVRKASEIASGITKSRQALRATFFSRLISSLLSNLSNSLLALSMRLS